MTEHKRLVCSLYKRSLRLLFDWIIDRPRHRSYVLAVRRQFDLNKNESNPQRIKLLTESAEYLLWKYRHPEPYKYPTAPGGVAYQREGRFTKEFLKNGFDSKMEVH